MKLIIFSLLVFVSFCGDFSAQQSPRNSGNANSQTIITPPKPEGNYQTKLKSIETERVKLARKYNQSADKKVILAEAEKLFISSIDTVIFPFWYGTDWDFYGTTQTPNEGKIACGYFVTTVLRDAGLRVQRVSLAQQASEKIVKSLTNETHIKRFRNATIEKFVADIKTLGAALYVVGLDNHVGFILNDGEEVYFIHSSYVEPGEVIKEKALTSPVLSSSKYRVMGNISGDQQLIAKWLNQTTIPTL